MGRPPAECATISRRVAGLEPHGIGVFCDFELHAAVGFRTMLVVSCELSGVIPTTPVFLMTPGSMNHRALANDAWFNPRPSGRQILSNCEPRSQSRGWTHSRQAPGITGAWRTMLSTSDGQARNGFGEGSDPGRVSRGFPMSCWTRSQRHGCTRRRRAPCSGGV